MEVKMDDAWKSVDAAVNYMMSWVWMVVAWMWPVVIVCLMLGGLKEVLMIGEWVPSVGPPMYWALVGACYWAVKPK